MGPDFAANVTSAIRSMEQTVIPAVDPKNSAAQEQAYLVLYHLRLFLDQHKHLLSFRLQEISDFHALTSLLIEKAHLKGVELGAAGEKAAIALSTSAQYLELRIPRYDDLAAAAQGLREVADQIVVHLRDQGGSDLLKSLGADELLLAVSGRDEARARAWVKALGMDPSPDDIPALADLMRNVQSPGTEA
jgi:hypothetical protein